MKARRLSIFWFFLVAVLCGCLQACGRHIPQYDRPIYTLDTETMTARYRGDQDVIPLSDESLHGAVVFKEDDFRRFVEIYISGCLKYDPALPTVSARRMIKENSH